MLKRVRVQNDKSLRDIEVEFASFTVLIGPKKSGKTSFFLTGLRPLGDFANPFDRQNAQRVASQAT